MKHHFCPKIAVFDSNRSSVFPFFLPIISTKTEVVIAYSSTEEQKLPVFYFCVHVVQKRRATSVVGENSKKTNNFIFMRYITFHANIQTKLKYSREYFS